MSDSHSFACVAAYRAAYAAAYAADDAYAGVYAAYAADAAAIASITLDIGSAEPVVIGYKQVTYGGVPYSSGKMLCKGAMIEMALSDYRCTKIKSKFHPIYAK